MNLDLVAYIGGIILALQIVPQMIKIYISKSSSDLSYMFMFLNLIGLSMMFVYALNNKDRPLYVTSGISITNTLMLVYMKYYYDCLTQIQKRKNKTIIAPNHKVQYKSHENVTVILNVAPTCQSNISLETIDKFKTVI